ncbi:hypothetical protein QCD85_16860 [Paenibacillus sp. PsM32]|uniref:hypothetical protein n=1 Tax=Paenibacillus sp. PsM32 TaxID=3030536 RepID=UPI00263AB8D1|nr:hypothetical protein [Paenibacillus sp. PsM32]MDN4619782.1 hypothetical protein [Paenibacillus sp. PsM32]
MNRHVGIVSETSNANYTGVTTKLTLPTTINVTSGYVDWYLGIGPSAIEAGISYKVGEGFRVFINGVEGADVPNKRSQRVSYLQPGQTVDMKLTYNHSTKRSSLFINSQVVPWADEAPVTTYTARLMNTLNTVKMVQGVEDTGSNVTSTASFSQPQLRMNAAGTIYNPWTASLSKQTIKRNLGDAGGDAHVYLVNTFPLAARIDKA